MSEIARRQFLKTAATGAVGLTFAGLRRQALAAGDDALRIGWVNARSGPFESVR